MAKKAEQVALSADGVKGKKALHKRALERYKVLDDHWADNAKSALEAIKFRSGEEWPEDIKRLREGAQNPRPCLSFRRGEQYIRQVVNDGRQNRPSVKYRPVDSGADIEVANAFQGLTRHILASSNADEALDTALDHSAGNGFGYFRILTEYEQEGGFEQRIVIRRVPNPLSVRLAPHQSADGADAEDGFVIDEMSREAFKRAYPNAEMVDWKANAKDYGEGWLTELNVRVAEYFYKEGTQSMVYLLEDGQTITQAQYENLLAKGADDVPGIVNKRMVRDVKVKWCKLSGAEILEEGEFPSRYIPILPVYGTERNINGKVVYEGLIHLGMTALRLYNFERTAYAERVALTPKAPYIAAEGQLEDNADWTTANTENHPYLTYKPVDVAGNPVPPPRREQAADIPSHYAQSIQITEGDIQAAFGMYNASIGAPSNEKSGRAIMARQREGDVSTFHYHDNLNRAVRHMGRILLDMIPRVYDSRRVVRLLNEDGTDKMAILDPNAPSGHSKGEKGLEIFNLNAGKFDVDVSAGPSYTTKRQESAEAMLEMAQQNPNVWQTHGDLIAKSQDWPDAEEFAKRTKAIMPPELRAAIEEGDGDDAEEIPPRVKAFMEQAQQAVQERDAALEQAMAALQAAQAAADEAQKAAKDKADELAIREREAAAKEEAERTKRYAAETDRLKEILPALTPEQAAFIVSQTLAQVATPLDLDLDPGVLIANQPQPMPEMAPAMQFAQEPQVEAEYFPAESTMPPEFGGAPMPLN